MVIQMSILGVLTIMVILEMLVVFDILVSFGILMRILASECCIRMNVRGGSCCVIIL